MITSSTGKGKSNKPSNIVILQLLFNMVCIYQKKDGSNGECTNTLSKPDTKKGFSVLQNLTIDGSSNISLIERIEAYQRSKSMQVINGWIGSNGATIKALMRDARVAFGTNRMTFIRKHLIAQLGVSAIKPVAISTLYQKQYQVLTGENKAGLEYILKTAKADKDVTLITELSYMLATTKHETAHTFRSIEEYGKGRGHSYGKEISVTHVDINKKSTTYKNKYYGRGYVQLTWGFNYQRIDEKLGNGIYPNKNKTKVADYNKEFSIIQSNKSIYLHPQKCLEKENAYIAMVYGMQKGIFTTKKIDDYISKIKVDYINARRIINGTDKAAVIAAYAEDFEILLLLSTG